MNIEPVFSEQSVSIARAQIHPYIRRTPVWQWSGGIIGRTFSVETEVLLKLELFQHTGSFKPRGALSNMLRLSPAELARGVTAVSAGNHAVAVAFAAAALGTTAKVVMPARSSHARVELCRSLGAEVVLVPDVQRAFEVVKEIERVEGRSVIHPFEGEATALGTATVGLEFIEDVGSLDVIVIPIGGGGLCAGIAAITKQMNPSCLVIGVEPTGADNMYRSILAGRPQSTDTIDTIADSLAPPYSLPYSFEVCRRFVDDIVRVDDSDLQVAMYILFANMKLAVEPAGAAATAALLGPLRERAQGRKVGLIVCGANIDITSYSEYVKRGEELCGSGDPFRRDRVV